MHPSYYPIEPSMFKALAATNYTDCPSVPSKLLLEPNEGVLFLFSTSMLIMAVGNRSTHPSNSKIMAWQSMTDRYHSTATNLPSQQMGTGFLSISRTDSRTLTCVHSLMMSSIAYPTSSRPTIRSDTLHNMIPPHLPMTPGSTHRLILHHSTRTSVSSGNT